jgi:hypothetical protein
MLFDCIHEGIQVFRITWQFAISNQFKCAP